MKYKINLFIPVYLLALAGMFYFSYNYHIRSINEAKHESIINLGKEMAQSDIKSNNLRWFWYSEGWDTNEATNQYFEKKYKIRINWDMASTNDDYSWRKSYNQVINDHLVIKYGQGFYKLYNDVYIHFR